MSKKFEGKCAMCGKAFSRRGMGRHLLSCKQRPTGRATTLLVFVESRWWKDYWMFIEMSQRATLGDLDDLLRGVWLECCGHLSCFTVGTERYQVTSERGFWGQQTQNMQTARVDRALPVGTRFGYEYDFGSTTELTGKAVRLIERTRLAATPRIVARNRPPAIPCESCDQAATQLCSFCGGTAVCDACRDAHSEECGGEGLLPLVNSPRAGVCCYGPAAVFHQIDNGRTGP